MKKVFNKSKSPGTLADPEIGETAVCGIGRMDGFLSEEILRASLLVPKRRQAPELELESSLPVEVESTGPLDPYFESLLEKVHSTSIFAF